MHDRLLHFAETARALVDPGLAQGTVLDTAVRRVSAVFQAPSIATITNDVGALEPIAVYHDDPDALSRVEDLIPGAARASTAVLSSGQGLLITTGDDPEPESGPGTSLMVVPLRRQQQVIGTLGTAREGRAAPFRADDLDLLGRIADIVSLALENARLHAEADAARSAAERSAQARDRILRTVSHELRQPLAVIAVNMSLLRMAIQRESATWGPQLGRWVVATIEAARIMSRLVDDLVDTAAIEDGRLKLRPEPFEAAQLVQWALEQHRELAARRGIALEAELPPETLITRGDRERLEQVLGNLLSNALRFVPPRGKVSIRVRAEQGFACFAVRDTGPGIDPAERERLFQPYAQGPAAEVGERSVGLGLFIARGIVETHGGRIWVESEPGRGATFAFTIPLAA